MRCDAYLVYLFLRIINSLTKGSSSCYSLFSIIVISVLFFDYLLLYSGRIVGVISPESLDSLTEFVRSVFDLERLIVTLAFYYILLRFIIYLTEFLL